MKPASAFPSPWPTPTLTRGTITIIYQVVGKTTALLATLEPNDSFGRSGGSFGQPHPHREKRHHHLCVGGGTGVAVLHPITRGFKEAGNKVIGIIGARNKDLIIMEDKMKACTDELYTYVLTTGPTATTAL